MGTRHLITVIIGGAPPSLAVACVSARCSRVSLRRFFYSCLRRCAVVEVTCAVLIFGAWVTWIGWQWQRVAAGGEA